MKQDVLCWSVAMIFFSLSCAGPNKISNADTKYETIVIEPIGQTADTTSFGAKGEITVSFDDSGKGVFGRKVIKRGIVKQIINQSGTIASKVCINKYGIVTYVALIPEETTIKDREILKLFMKAASGYKYEPDLNAPKEQCGKLKFIVESSTNSNNNYHLKDDSIRKQK